MADLLYTTTWKNDLILCLQTATSVGSEEKHGTHFQAGAENKIPLVTLMPIQNIKVRRQNINPFGTKTIL